MHKQVIGFICLCCIGHALRMQKAADPIDEETFQTPPQQASPRAWPSVEQAPPQREDTFWERMADAKAGSGKRPRQGDEEEAYPVSEIKKAARVKRHEQSTPWTHRIHTDAVQVALPKTGRDGDEAGPYTMNEMRKKVKAKRVELGMPGTYSVYTDAIQAAPYPVSETKKIDAAEKETRIKSAVQDLVSYAANIDESTKECAPREGMDIREAMRVCHFPDCWHRAGKTAVGKACNEVFPNGTAHCAASRQSTWDVFAKCLTVQGFWRGHLCTIPFPQIEDSHVVIFKYAKHLQQRCSKVSRTMPKASSLSLQAK